MDLGGEGLAAFELPLRPNLGTLGRPVWVLTNHFRTRLADNVSIFMYDVVITEADGRPIERLPALKVRSKNGTTSSF